MKTATKKLIVFVLIISLFTSTYASFLATIMKQGFLTDHFYINWLILIPRTYLFMFPFVLITGPITSTWVDKMFENNKEHKTN